MPRHLTNSNEEPCIGTIVRDKFGEAWTAKKDEHGNFWESRHVHADLGGSFFSTVLWSTLVDHYGPVAVIHDPRYGRLPEEDVAADRAARRKASRRAKLRDLHEAIDGRPYDVRRQHEVLEGILDIMLEDNE